MSSSTPWSRKPSPARRSELILALVAPALAAALAVAGAVAVSRPAAARPACASRAPEFLSDVLRDWRRAKKAGGVDTQLRLALAARAAAVAEVAVGRERYEALRFVATLDDGGACAELVAARDRALARLVEAYVDDGELMGECVLRVLRAGQHDAKLREEIHERTRSDAVRAACELQPIEAIVDRAREDGELVPADRERALLVLERIAAAYPEARHPLSAGTWKEYASAAAQLLREIVLIGEAAPEIAATDVAGKPLRLSDQRGKVVLLCFWGDWSVPCRALYARQRELAAKLSGKPFALLGIGSDPELATAARVCAAERFTWPNVWDGPEGTSGRVAARWRIRGWPTWWLIDAQGVVRARWLGAPAAEELDLALATWITRAR